MVAMLSIVFGGIALHYGTIGAGTIGAGTAGAGMALAGIIGASTTGAGASVDGIHSGVRLTMVAFMHIALGGVAVMDHITAAVSMADEHTHIMPHVEDLYTETIASQV